MVINCYGVALVANSTGIVDCSITDYDEQETYNILAASYVNRLTGKIDTILSDFSIYEVDDEKFPDNWFSISSRKSHSFSQIQYSDTNEISKITAWILRTTPQ